MGLEEKMREDSYWAEFSETGKMPNLPNAIFEEKGELYFKSILFGTYNSLTKLLFGEILVRNGLLDEEGIEVHANAAEWVKKMIFSKTKCFPKSKEMGESFREMAKQSKNLKIVELVSLDSDINNAWEWIKLSKVIFSEIGKPSSSEFLRKHISDLKKLSKSSTWSNIMQNGKLYFSILFWFGKIVNKAKGNLCGGENDALLFMSKIDLSTIPSDCLVRKSRESKPEKGLSYYPSTLEDLASGIYFVFKAKLKSVKDVSESQKKWLLWAVDFLNKVYSMVEDEWGNFRIGKLLIWSGDIKHAKEFILPTARKKSSEFWVWSLMADLFPEKRINCLARALICHADKKYTTRIIKEALTLNIPVNNDDALFRLAKNSDDLLLTGISPIKGVYLNSFTKERNGNKAPYMVFADAEGKALAPISPFTIHFHSRLDYGSPVWLYFAPEDEKSLLAVKQRKDGMLWDTLNCIDATYFGVNRGGAHQFTDGEHEYVALGNCDKSVALVLGNVYSLYYTCRNIKDKIVYNVHSIKVSVKKSNLIGVINGVLKNLKDINSPAFIENVFIPPNLLNTLKNNDVDLSLPMRVDFVKLPEENKINNFGQTYSKKRYCAISCTPLYGDDLEYFIDINKKGKSHDPSRPING